MLGTVAWLLLASRGDFASTTFAVLSLLTTAISFLLSRRLTKGIGAIVPLLLITTAGLLAYLRSEILILHGAVSPLGYSNATGAFYLLASAAGLQLGARAKSARSRRLGVTSAVLFAAVPWLNRTATAAILVCFLPLGSLARRPSRVRLTVVCSAAVYVVTLLAAIALGGTYTPENRDGWLATRVDATLSERRLMLWRDALSLLVHHPVNGMGIGRFKVESRTAREDADTIWPHNEALHFGVEAGFPGLFLLIGIFAWGFGRLWWGAADPAAAIAAIALGAAGVHSNVDYILHFPPVFIALAAVVGVGSCRANAQTR